MYPGVLVWSAAFDGYVGQERDSHIVSAVDGDNELVYFLYDGDKIGLHVLIVFVVYEMCGVSGIEAMKVPSFYAAARDCH